MSGHPLYHNDCDKIYLLFCPTVPFYYPSFNVSILSSPIVNLGPDKLKFSVQELVSWIKEGNMFLFKQTKGITYRTWTLCSFSLHLMLSVNPPLCTTGEDYLRTSFTPTLSLGYHHHFSLYDSKANKTLHFLYISLFSPIIVS